VVFVMRFRNIWIRPGARGGHLEPYACISMKTLCVGQFDHTAIWTAKVRNASRLGSHSFILILLSAFAPKLNNSFVFEFESSLGQKRWTGTLHLSLSWLAHASRPKFPKRKRRPPRTAIGAVFPDAAQSVRDHAPYAAT